MDDTVYRQAAIELADAMWEATHDKNIHELWSKLKDLPPAQPDLDEWCTDCKEYDQEKHCCPRWNRVIRKTAEEVRQNAQPRWIPVTERLPIEEFEEGRKNGTVYDLYPCLVTRYSTHTDEPRTRTYVCKSYFDGEDFMLHGGYAPDEGSDAENTLAWMPLPTAYEKEEENA